MTRNSPERCLLAWALVSVVVFQPQAFAEHCDPFYSERQIAVVKGTQEVKLNWIVRPAVYADKTWYCDGTETVWSYAPHTWSLDLVDVDENVLAAHSGEVAQHIYSPACDAQLDIPVPPAVPFTDTVDVSSLTESSDTTLYLRTRSCGHAQEVSRTFVGCYSEPWHFVLREFDLSVCGGTPPVLGPLTATAPNSQGNVTVSVPFSFPDTFDQESRDLDIYFDDRYKFTHNPIDLSDTFTVTKDACGEVKVVATSCDAPGDPAFSVSRTLRLPVENCKRDICTKGSCKAMVGKPIHVGSGDVWFSEPLFTIGQEPLAVQFTLDYHSTRPVYPSLVTSPVGNGWRHSFAQTLRPVQEDEQRLYHIGPDGLETYFERQSDGTWNAFRPAESRLTVSKSGSQYLLRDLDGTVNAFDVETGRWLSITDRWGNQITGSYTDKLLTTLTDALGRQVSFAYNGGRVAEIKAGDSSWRFDYQDDRLIRIFDHLHPGPNPWRSFEYANDGEGEQRLLSAVRDDAGMLVEAHSYDNQDRGLTSVVEEGKESVLVQYDVPAAGKSRVTHSISSAEVQTTDLTLIYQGGRYLPTELVGTCATCGGGSAEHEKLQYDESNRLIQRTDANGKVTTYSYDSNGNLISQTEAAGTPRARTSSYEYSEPGWPNFLTKMTEPSVAKPGAVKTTSSQWNSAGTILTESVSGYLNATESAVQTTTTTFDAQHRVLSVEGPREDVSDVTIRSYYLDTDPDPNRRGRLRQLTAPPGLLTTFDGYDFWGTARQVTDPNGVVTQYQTDAKGRTVSTTLRAVGGDPNESSDYTTTYTFDGRDRLIETTMPRGNKTRYVYESGTNRLTDTIRLDFRGREIERRHLTLDLIGNVTTEEDQRCNSPESFCSSWTTTRSVSYSYDDHNRLREIVHPVPAGAKVVYGYDPEGKLASIKDENHSSPNTTYAYDELDRLATVTQTLGVGAVLTKYSYDAHDNLASVTDPNGNTTTFSYDDFGRMTRQVSPVTGTTTYGYDAAGNLTSTTDARGATTTRTYDAANRVLSATSTLAGQPTEIVTWTYDDAAAGNYGKGRLGSMTDGLGAVKYGYDRRGLLRTETRTYQSQSLSVSYSYDANGNRQRITYPSGRVVDYTFDFADRPLSAVSGATTYISSAAYEPFGPLRQLSYGNGTTRDVTYDTRYRLTENKLSQGGTTIAQYSYRYDPLGNIIQVTDSLDAGYNRSFGYDELNRLTSANTGSRLWGPGSYSYDAMGNLKTLSLGTGRSAVFNYIGPTPKLSSVTQNGITLPVGYDAAGNETSYISRRSYSARNLMSQLREPTGARTFLYDGRSVRTVGPILWGDNVFSAFHVYTPEFSLLSRIAGPTAHQEVIWFGGQPVAQEFSLDPVPRRYTFTDHLGTPILQTNPSGTVVWRAEHEPYGNIFAMRAGTASDQPLRFPGQELLTTAEGTEESYNIFRWYRSAWGRYTQPDPIGLEAGVNVYFYVAANPLKYFDPLGLAYFAKRPLSGASWIPLISCNPFYSLIDAEPSHEQLFFEDGKSPENIGFFSDGTLKTEPDVGYRCRSGKYDDCIMREAVKRVGIPAPYCLLGKLGPTDKFNCQDWASLVRNKYKEIKNDPTVKENCCPTKKGGSQNWRDRPFW